MKQNRRVNLKTFFLSFGILFSLLVTVNCNAQNITVTDDFDEGQESWKITTPTATYYYHKTGAGFSSILDRHGNDWIDYHPGNEAHGEFRGIPNMVFGSNGYYFHPGHSGDRASTSTLTKASDKVIINSVSNNEEWAVKWEICETHATMTVTKVGGVYWFLYEGTPGGGYETDLDWYMHSDGVKNSVGQDRVGDIPEPEWIVFGEEGLNTTFFLVHHQDDEISDTYMNWGAMTVFGFGRAGRDDYTGKMSGHDQFSIGFLETSDHSKLNDQILSIISP